MKINRDNLFSNLQWGHKEVVNNQKFNQLKRELFIM